MKLSIVTTLYRSRSYIAEFYARASAAARAHAGDDYEIVMVNDGSPDDSLNIAVRLAEEDPHVTVVDLSRNFGHHKAIMTGLAHSVGDHVFLLDVDLEEEPEWLAEFAAAMREKGCDVVFGVQKARKGGWFERWSGHCFYTVMDAITGLKMPANAVTARLMTRRYVDALLLHKEQELYIDGLFCSAGFEQAAYTVTKHSLSASTYTFRKKMALLVNSVTSFSNAPLVVISYIGFAISLFSFVYMLHLIIQRVIFSCITDGWTSIMASIWLMGGLIILFIGVVGVYVSKIFLETKQRPYTIIRRVYGQRRQ
ncbi:putative glycosyltransferases [uncultured delta proteobacterium]|uniref:Putative glycosyltransferases n=1 Tax=uncultured delta proteobacterium TaxID=34034 RepID=A0A212KDC9_9DELT|nr:putative glycosyltransferases [uncultured delta proteobacterium]